MRSALIALTILCLTGIASGQSLALDDGQTGIGFAGNYARAEGTWSGGISASLAVFGRVDFDAILAHTDGGPDSWGFGVDLYLIRPANRIGPLAMTVGGSHQWANLAEKDSRYLGPYGGYIQWDVERDVSLYNVNALLHHGLALSRSTRLWLSYGIGVSGTSVSGRGSDESTFGTTSLMAHVNMSSRTGLVIGPSVVYQGNTWYFGLTVGAMGALTGDTGEDLDGTPF